MDPVDALKGKFTPRLEWMDYKSSAFDAAWKSEARRLGHKADSDARAVIPQSDTGCILSYDRRRSSADRFEAATRIKAQVCEAASLGLLIAETLRSIWMRAV